MKKILALALALIMVLAFAACGAKTEAPAEEPVAVEETPVVETTTGDASGEMGEASGEAEAPAEDEASGEMGASEENNGPIEKFDIAVNALVIGEGASAISAVGGESAKVVVDFTWTGSDGSTVTLDEGEFKEGEEYTLSLTFKAAEGSELTDPVSVKFVGAVGTEYEEVASTDADENGAPIFEMVDVLTLAAGESQASSEEPAA